jgi:hypothetical protein
MWLGFEVVVGGAVRIDKEISVGAKQHKISLISKSISDAGKHHE